MVIITTWTRVHRCHQHKTRRISHRVFGTADTNVAVLERLTQDFQHLTVEFRKLIQNNTPLCASEISPGIGLTPPPTSATGEIVWCGARNGRRVSRWLPPGNLPATECIRVVSNVSSSVNGGKLWAATWPSSICPTRASRSSGCYDRRRRQFPTLS